MAKLNWSDVLQAQPLPNSTSLPNTTYLSSTTIPPGGTQIEGQIGQAEDPQIVSIYRDLVVPMIRQSKVNTGHLRILELGSGYGKLAYGTFQNCSPELYVATDVTPDLFQSLSANLARWAAPHVPTGVAIMDPQDPLLFRHGYFNVIQSYSVLHHVLNYKNAIASLYDKLASPGILLFMEPFVDGYLFFCTLARIIANRFYLTDSLKAHLAALEENVIARTLHREDPQFLSQFGTGDKHIYSIHDLLELANSLDAQLVIQRDNRNLRDLFLGEFQLRGATESELHQIGQFLTDVIPTGIEHAFFSDLRQAFCFVKRASRNS